MEMQEQLPQESPGIYFIVNFDWPDDFSPDIAQTAKKLHVLTSENPPNWIHEVVAASGGIGGDEGSVWIFWLPNYSSLDKLFHDQNEEISRTYRKFFSSMKKVRDSVRDKVQFL